MIRVLHYVGKMDRGGMETLIMNLYRNIDRTEIQFDFAVHGNRNGDFEQEILEMGGKFFQFPHMRKNPVAYRKAWRSFWREHKEEYRAFHMHTNSLANIIALEEAARAEIPIRIVHSHSSFANKGKLQWLNNYLHKKHRKRVAEIATNLIACSDKAAEWMFGGMQLGSKKVTLLNNGVDIQKFSYSSESRKKIRAELNVPEDTLLLGQIGAFLPVKNHEFTIQLINALKDRKKNVCLLLIGDGPLKFEIKKKCQESMLSDVVKFLGKRSDINEILSALDIYIMPSLYEGLPVSLVEAQVNGVASIISNRITHDVEFNDNISYLSIDEGVKPWVDSILSLETNHKADLHKIIEHGFDIVDSCAQYRKLLNYRG